MEVKAKLRHLRIAPRKVRLVVNVVRGLSLVDAENQLLNMNKRAAHPVLKLIRSAAASAEHNYKLNRNDLVVKTIQVDDAMTFKRWQPRAMGRATMLRKRGSHVKVVLDLKPEAKQAAQAKAKSAKPKTTKKPVAKKSEKKEVKKTSAKAEKKTTKKPAAKKTKTTKKK